MNIRIIAGLYKGRNMVISGKAAQFRPTMGKVRKAVADSLGNRIPGAKVADICAGSGSFGFEMLSRGAKHVYFIESNQLRCLQILTFARKLKVENQCCIVKKDIRRFIETNKKQFDILYYDPPYNDNTLEEIVPLLLPLVLPMGILIYEQEKGGSSYFRPDKLIVTSRQYGNTVIDYMKLKSI